MTMNIFFQNRCLLYIHPEIGIIGQTFQKRSKPKRIPVCYTGIEMVQPGQVLMRRGEHIDIPPA